MNMSGYAIAVVHYSKVVDFLRYVGIVEINNIVVIYDTMKGLRNIFSRSDKYINLNLFL